MCDEDRESTLSHVSRVTHGFVATDLVYLCSQVVMQLVNDAASSSNPGEVKCLCNKVCEFLGKPDLTCLNNH